MKLRSLLRNFLFSFITCTAGLGLLATSGNAQKTQLEEVQKKNTMMTARPQNIGYGVIFHEVDKGGHFAAWEQPQVFSEELRAAFRSLRSNQANTSNGPQR